MARRIVKEQPFDMSYTITFSGVTVGDGKPTTTTQMIHDKLLYVLEKLLLEGNIRDFQISVQRNNIVEAHKTIAKSKEPVEKRG